MTSRILRILAATLIALSAVGAAIPAKAATMPWTWTDISGQLTVRQNRPIWATAYASPFWYYTDGQNLWNGGQVYRFDGQTQVNITTDVRNAGLSRVDEIVTDGVNVVFLQDVYRLDNLVQAVMYRNGSYRSITSTIRQTLDTNEGISSIVGRNGSWLMVTTRARLVKFNEDISSYTRLSTPSDMKQLSSSDPSLLYSARARMDRGSYTSSYAGINIAPTGNSFLVVVGRAFQTSSQNIAAFYRFDGQGFTKISGPNLTGSAYTLDVNGLASNGLNTLLITNQQVSLGRSGKIYTYDGSSWTEVAGNWLCVDGAGACNSNDFTDASNFSAIWDGSQWMIISGKNLSRIANNTFEHLGQARDYFVTGASNGSGAILLGGAVSDLSNLNPTYPLTAKLVKVTVGVSNTTSGTSSSNTTNTTNQTAYGISSWTWLDPNQNYIRRDQNLAFNVGAQSAKGLKRIEIVVNGAVAKTCELDGSANNQTCAFPVWGGSYNLGTTVSVNAKITDKKNTIVWTGMTSLTVTDASGSTQSTNTGTTSNVTTNYDTHIWDWLDPNTTTLAKNGSMTYYTGAQSDQGISRVELWVNGSIRRTCDGANSTGNVTCSVTLYGSDYVAGSDVAVNARAIDKNGRETWTTLRHFSVLTDTSTTGATTPTSSEHPTAHWSWSNPETSTIATNQTVVFTIGAWDADGMRSAEFYVNGYIWKTCSFGDVKTAVECAVQLNGANWNPGGGVYVNARLLDSQGRETWTAFRQYAVVAATNGSTSQNQASGSSTNTTTDTSVTNLPGWVSITSNHDAGFTDNQTIAFTVTANDQNGVDKIELFVEGIRVKICTNTTSCSWTGGPFNGKNFIHYGATITDKAGYTMWTGYKVINHL